MRTLKNDLKKNIFLILCFCFLVVICSACQSTPPYDQSIAGPFTIEKVMLAPGDELEIKFAYAEQFNELQRIRPDGNIELQFIGEVSAAGKSPAELREELKEKFSKHLKHPQLAVIVRSFNEQRVYVGGEVNTPGMIPLPNQMTALEAIMQAGGFDMETAKTGNIVVIRHDTDGMRQGYALNLNKALKGDHVSTFYLQPRDIVYVPRSTITKINQFTEQYVNKLVPDIGLTFTRSLGRTGWGYDTGD